MKQHLKVTLSLLLLILSFAACYEPQDGCLEAWATNYNLLADTPCGDCCTKPKLTWKQSFVVSADSSTYTFGDTLFDNQLRPYKILSVNLFSHSYNILNDGIILPFEEDTTVILNVAYDDDFGFSTGSSVSIAQGEYVDDLTVNGVKYQIGLPSTLRDTSIFGKDNATVAQAIDSLYNPTTDAFSAMTFTAVAIRDTVPDTMKFVSFIAELTFDDSFSNINISVGQNTTIKNAFFIDTWMNTVDLFNPSDSIANVLVKRLFEHNFVD